MEMELDRGRHPLLLRGGGCHHLCHLHRRQPPEEQAEPPEHQAVDVHR